MDRRLHQRLSVLVALVALGATWFPHPDAATARRHGVQTAHAQAGLPALPSGWPGVLHLGMGDAPGGAATMRATAPFGLRSQYLAGGANTGTGWATWNPNGDFATFYIQESAQHGMIPVFDYYQLLQSLPSSGSDEGQRNFNNLQNRSTMQAYYADLKLFMQKAGAQQSTRIVFHFEPDLWGQMQQRAAGGGAASIPAQVAATGLAELTGLPNNLTGFARAATVLRDRYAPNVLVAYHVSLWGTGTDITISDPPDAQVDALADLESAFFASLGTPFDLLFYDPLDRDAAFYQYQYGDTSRWWNAADFRRALRFLGRTVQQTQKRVILWQIPLGNTRMRAQNNTWNHYQDNRVEWWLDDPTRGHLDEWRQAGVLAFIFGRGADGPTCACDANQDGVTNPPPINGNTGVSLNADDDGGFFRQKAAAYYTSGPMSLPGGAPPPSCSPRPKVTLTTSRVGQNLQVDVSTGAGPISQIRYDAARNALITVGNRTNVPGGFTYVPTSVTSQVTFTARPASGSPAMMVPFVVVDACGDWRTFVGVG